MCGILGVISSDKNFQKDDFLKALKAIRHRGSDGCGFLDNKNIFLGQNRLAIIDLSSSGHQPMSLKCPRTNKKLHLVFNGTIYNYKELKKQLKNLGHFFLSSSDTEVILHSYEEWENSCFLKFRGMFAGALYDEFQNEILLFRDRFGIKPIYYYFDGKNFAFSSEIKAFWEMDFVKKEINQSAIFEFLRYGYIAQPQTFYKNIYHLDPGSILKVNFLNNSFQIKKERFADIFDFYTLPKQKISFNEAIKVTKDALTDSIFHHLVADVEVGLFLSGGIDSCILLYLLRKLKQDKIKTISAVFPGTYCDESEKINELVKEFNTDHLELKITSKDFLENLDNIFYHMDQPSVDGVNTYFVSLAAKKAGLKVVLSGLGGDELFYGYPSFFDLPKFQKIKNLLKTFGIGYGLKLFSLANRFNIKLAKITEITNSKNLLEAYLAYRSIFTKNQIKNILEPELIKDFSEEKIKDSFKQIKEILSQISFFEMNVYLKNQLLRDSDVFSMAHSIELRVPFVDNVLFEKIVPIPDKYKIKNNISKFLLKEILKGKVSEKILSQKKQGFVIPIEFWMRENFDIIKNKILNSEIYNRKTTEKLINMFLSKKLHWSRIWSLYVLGRFLK